MALFNSCSHRVLALALPLMVAVGCSSSSDDTELDNLAIGAANPSATDETSAEDTDESAEPVVIELAGPAGDFGPFADAANEVRSAYTGNAEPAALSAENASDIMDMVLFGPLSAGDNKLFASGYLASTLMRHAPGDLVGLTTSTEADYRVCANEDGSGLMNWGVSEEIDASLREVSLTYTHCLIEGKFFDGVVLFASGAEVLNDTTTEHYFRYDNLEVTQADNTVWTFNGVDAVPAGASCEASGAVQAYFSAERADTGVTWLFDNLVTTLYQDDAGTRCAALFSDVDEPSIYSTTLAHSDFGVVKVAQGTTQESALSVRINGEGVDFMSFEKSFQAPPADLELTDLQVHQDSVAWGTVNATFSGVEQTPVAQALTAVRLGGLFPMSDGDNDGLTDGYELAYGLADSDATDDVDQDGLNALEELAAGSNPTDVRDNGWLVDRQITLLRTQAGAAVETFYVSIDNQAVRLSASEFEFTVSVTGDATFASTEAESTPTFDFFGNSTTFAEVSCEYTDLALNSLRCSAGSDEVCVTYNENGQSVVECDSNLLLQRKFSVNPGVSGPFVVNAELSAHPQERNLVNNLAVGEN